MSEKVSIIYRAPKGDSKVLEWAGHTFYDGKDTDLDKIADAAILKKIEGHPHFEVAGKPKLELKAKGE